jgi:hypothetical protein
MRAALRGAEYLQLLLRQDRLISERSVVLDKIYALKSPPVIPWEDIPLGPSTQELLLSKPQIQRIADEFQDKEIVSLGNRAITQITKQLDLTEETPARAKEQETENKEK